MLGPERLFIHVSTYDLLILMQDNANHGRASLKVVLKRICATLTHPRDFVAGAITLMTKTALGDKCK